MFNTKNHFKIPLEQLSYLSFNSSDCQPNSKQTFRTSFPLPSVKLTHAGRYSTKKNVRTLTVTRAVNHPAGIAINRRHRTAQLRRLLRVHLVAAPVGLRPGRGVDFRRLAQRVLSGMPRRPGPHEGLQRERGQPAVCPGSQVCRSQVHLRSM